MASNSTTRTGRQRTTRQRTTSKTTPRRKSQAAMRRPKSHQFGAFFFVVVAVTVLSALGFMGVVAAVLAGA